MGIFSIRTSRSWSIMFRMVGFWSDNIVIRLYISRSCSGISSCDKLLVFHKYFPRRFTWNISLFNWNFTWFLRCVVCKELCLPSLNYRIHITVYSVYFDLFIQLSNSNNLYWWIRSLWDNIVSFDNSGIRFLLRFNLSSVIRYYKRYGENWDLFFGMLYFSILHIIAFILLLCILYGIGNIRSLVWDSYWTHMLGHVLIIYHLI